MESKAIGGLLGVILGLVLGLLLVFGVSWLFMWGWNTFAVVAFHAPKLNFWSCVGAFVLIRVISLPFQSRGSK